MFVGTFFICQFVLMMQFLWRYVDELIGKGLSIDVLAQFFWYMCLMLMPQAFPLAILLSSLISFGNLGESSELTAIKAAGISLMQAFRSLIVITLLVAGCSFYFQNNISPEAYKSLYRLLISMKQTSPELEIPEGIFYNGIPGTNLYVEKKDLESGKLYGIIIYQINNSYEDAAIIVADSGMLQSTAEKKHLLLTLYSGEWFENMKAQDVAHASVPYRRESFVHKQIVLDFDGEFNMAEATGVAGSAQAKSLSSIAHDIDSIKQYNDSLGNSYYNIAKRSALSRPHLQTQDSLRLTETLTATQMVDVDSVFQAMTPEQKQAAVKAAMSDVRSHKMELDMRSGYMKDQHKNYRRHQIEAIKKFTMSLSCLIFFFIGAPLGAIIRKGGLGLPVIISVIIYIIYYILENTGMKMARDDNWTVAFGMSLSTMVLAPLAVFFTYKANRDSALFNMEFYRNLLTTVFGIRGKRNIAKKDVIIEDPSYEDDMRRLAQITEDITEYSRRHRLINAPNPLKIFFRSGNDHRISDINEELEAVISDLSNARDREILKALNTYPIMATHAHTRPFRRRWLNVLSAVIVPFGIFIYLRMWRYRLRLLRDLRVIKATNERIIARIEQGLRERDEQA